MFKKVEEGNVMPEYEPDGFMANGILEIMYFLKIIPKDEAQSLMLEQLVYWRIQT